MSELENLLRAEDGRLLCPNCGSPDIYCVPGEEEAFVECESCSFSIACSYNDWSVRGTMRAMGVPA